MVESRWFDMILSSFWGAGDNAIVIHINSHSINTIIHGDHRAFFQNDNLKQLVTLYVHSNSMIK